MKRLLLISYFLSFPFISCEDDFSPFGEFNEKYILTCILRGDTTYQTATLSSSYFTGTLDPDDNKLDPAIRFADVRIWYEDSVYVLEDTSLVRIDTSRYSTPLNFYFTNRFKVSYNKPIEIEVLLQNGRRLKASSLTPKDILFSNNNSILVPPVDGNVINVFWSNGSTGAFYLPKLFFRYRINTDNVITEHETEIPHFYSMVNGTESPVYTTASNRMAIIYNIETITKTLESISASNENSIISVYEKLSLRISVMDENLTRYVSTTSQSFDDLTVRVNENDYTNVEGGLGIFGSYINKNYDKLKFQPQYIQSFGYKFIYEN